MNLTRVLNVALPDIPSRTLGQRMPRIPPDVVFKEHIEDGKPIVRVLVSSQDAMYRFSPENWELVQLFDGHRSFQEIAELHFAQSGREYSLDEIREFAASLESLDFWHKTSQEKNIQLLQKSAEERRKLLKSRKSRFGDLSEIAFPAINPDKFVSWLYGKTTFIYTPWFTLLSLAAFALMTGISITHWSEIGRDTLQFFNFTQKSFMDVVVFYVLALSTMCIHELAHAHACKHFGGRVRSMGFLLIYLTPAFFTDTSEGFVMASRSQRLIMAMAGAWVELIICAIATPIWWATPPDTMTHEVAYLLMLMTGIASLMINWNPLMKLDGYYMLCEIVGIADLKEASTAYASAWVKNKIWKLPVEIPYVPRRRRLGFAIYALLSGFYSYTVLYIIARFVGNVFRNFDPAWSFIPELATAALIFRSRIRTLVNFMKFLYLDKKDRLLAWLSSRQALYASTILLLFLFLPLWNESSTGRFELEPVQRAIVRNVVPGTITEVYAQEGETVQAGTPLIRLRNLPLDSRAARASSEYAVASSNVTSASLRYTNLGPALQQREQLAQRTRLLASQQAHLDLASPLSGVILTPHLADSLGSYAPEGTELVEVADLTRMRARIYVSEHDLSKISVGAPARLLVEGLASKRDGHVSAITPASFEIAPGLAGPNKYEGLNPPKFYILDAFVLNADGRLKPGMAGTAKIYGHRRNLAALAGRQIESFFARKAW